MTTRAVSFVAKSGTGKTTLLEKVITELSAGGTGWGSSNTTHTASTSTIRARTATA